MHVPVDTLCEKSGDRRLTARTRDPKAILVIGRRRDIEGNGSTRDAEVRRDSSSYSGGTPVTWTS
ncbi:hypothetical protein [Sinorhizobium meliloti]|uniref:hypothetical protein n=1 Tax=Rhizobium meliloti TaxID=382 RepID=UPI00398CC4BB